MANVNYIVEHESFIVYANDNGLSASEQLLWYALIHLFNQRAKGGQWPDGFIRITNKTLLSMMPMKVDAMMVARNQLKQRGLIDFVPGRKKIDIPMYRINYFSAPVSASEEEEPALYTEKTYKEPDKPPYKPPYKTPDIINKHNETENKTISDDDDGSDARVQRELDLTQSLAEAWCDAYGPEPTPGEARRIVGAAMILGTSPVMLAKAVELAAYNSARNPGPYVVDIIKTWRDQEIATPEEYAKEDYLRRFGSRSAEDTIRDRDERRRLHREGGTWQ